MAMVILVNARPLSNLSVNANCRVPASVKRLVHRTVPLASSVGGDAQRTFSSIVSVSKTVLESEALLKIVLNSK